uniref:Uncharacterized protein n=1 Tax=Angiostrongylus cantonensis TaxID=6313 RepID=A0A0K0D6E8_ANGCA
MQLLQADSLCRVLCGGGGNDKRTGQLDGPSRSGRVASLVISLVARLIFLMSPVDSLTHSSCSGKSPRVQIASDVCWNRLRTVALAICSTREKLEYHQFQLHEGGDLHYLVEAHQLVRSFSITCEERQNAGLTNPQFFIVFCMVCDAYDVQNVQVTRDAHGKHPCPCSTIDSICNVHLPPVTELIGHQEIEISAALGYVAHFLDCVAKLLDYQFRYPLQPGASSSSIYFPKENKRHVNFNCLYLIHLS